MRLVQRQIGGSVFFGAQSSASTGVTSSSSALSPGSGSFSFAWWGKYPTTAGLPTKSIAQFNTALYTTGWLINQNGPNTISLYINTASAQVSIANAIPDGNWHRYVMVADGTGHLIYLYRDGISLIAPFSSSWGTLISNAALAIGASQFGSAGGNMADVCYDVGHAWTLAQIQADYFNNVQPNTITQRWPLNDGVGITAFASVGGLNMTLTTATFSSDSPMKLRGSVQNLVAQSDAPATSPWSLGNLTSNGTQAGPYPTGVTSMVILKDTTDGSPTTHIASQVFVPLTIGQTAIISGVAKKVAGSGWVLVLTNASTSFAYFDIGNIAVGGTSNVISPGIIDLGNGFVLFWFSYLVTSTTGLVSLRFASANNTGTYQGSGANQLAFGGMMTEIAVSGQTTPSPRVATGATPLSVFGYRETRQNLLPFGSKDLTKWTQISTPTITGGQPDPFGGTTASLIQDTSAAAFQGFQQIFPVPVNTAVYAISLFVKKDLSATADFGFNFQFTGNVTATTSFRMRTDTGATGNVTGVSVNVRAFNSNWWKVTSYVQNNGLDNSFNISMYAAPGAINFSGDSVTAVGSVTVCQLQMVQTGYSSVAAAAAAGYEPDFIESNGSPINANGAPRSFQSRGQVTNLAFQSESIVTSPWGFTAATGPSYGGPYPTGVTAMQTLTDNSSNSAHAVTQSVSGINITSSYIFSCYAKVIAGTGYLAVYLGGATGYFNLSTGALGNTLSVTSGIISLGGGLYRCWIQPTTLIHGIANLLLCGSANSSAAYTGPSQQIAVGGMMIEKAVPGQTTPSAYIPTTTTAITIVERDYKQNLAQYSEAISTSPPWTATNVSAVDNSITGPGNIQMSLVTATGAGVINHFVEQVITAAIPTVNTQGRNMTLSMIAKAGTSSYIVIGTSIHTLWYRSKFFLSGAGSVIFNDGAVGTITSLGSGFYWIQVTWTTPYVTANQNSDSALISPNISTGGTASVAFNQSGESVYVGAINLSVGTQASYVYTKTLGAQYNPSGAPRSIIT